jgi:hypothetical protein
MKFYQAELYQPKLKLSFEQQRESILAILPESRIEHIGASSLDL